MNVECSGLSQVLVNGMPLAESDLDVETFEESIVSAIMKATPEIQKAVYNGDLHEVRYYK